MQHPACPAAQPEIIQIPSCPGLLPLAVSVGQSRLTASCWWKIPSFMAKLIYNPLQKYSSFSLLLLDFPLSPLHSLRKAWGERIRENYFPKLWGLICIFQTMMLSLLHFSTGKKHLKPSKQNLLLSSLYHVVGEYYHGIERSDFSTSPDNKRTVFAVLHLYMVHIEYHDMTV